ncbi:TPA: hypothetical protein HA361_02935 [Candidatus Woesearchaeota archaeon]|nr:hypothetical protein [Candidatus Woesearchaeota archaeon]HII68664.1 hypothetical protein [Candidatus Woesearchaeota archaeon]
MPGAPFDYYIQKAAERLLANLAGYIALAIVVTAIIAAVYYYFFLKEQLLKPSQAPQMQQSLPRRSIMVARRSAKARAGPRAQPIPSKETGQETAKGASSRSIYNKRQEEKKKKRAEALKQFEK